MIRIALKSGLICSRKVALKRHEQYTILVVGLLSSEMAQRKHDVAYTPARLQHQTKFRHKG